MADDPTMRALVRALLWREAVASVELDRDQTHTLDGAHTGPGPRPERANDDDDVRGPA